MVLLSNCLEWRLVSWPLLRGFTVVSSQVSQPRRPGDQEQLYHMCVRSVCVHTLDRSFSSLYQVRNGLRVHVASRNLENAWNSLSTTVHMQCCHTFLTGEPSVNVTTIEGKYIELRVGCMHALVLDSDGKLLLHFWFIPLVYIQLNQLLPPATLLTYDANNLP